MDMAAYKLYLNEINNKIRNYNMLKANLLSLIDKKMAIIIELKTDISGLEHLKEKQFGEYFRLNQKEQEINLEEFVSRSRYFAV
jgi:flagellar biosynthesis chaperone FliJ